MNSADFDKIEQDIMSRIVNTNHQIAIHAFHEGFVTNPARKNRAITTVAQTRQNKKTWSNALKQSTESVNSN